MMRSPAHGMRSHQGMHAALNEVNGEGVLMARQRTRHGKSKTGLANVFMAKGDADVARQTPNELKPARITGGVHVAGHQELPASAHEPMRERP